MEKHYYSVFGLTLASDFEFDILDTVVPAPDVDLLRVRRVQGIRPVTSPEVDPYFDIQPDRQFFNWNAVGTFIIKDPATVLIEPQDSVSDHLVSQAFLGLVISLVLERRGVLCLHASAVSVQNRAALFLGDKGAGKSTTNAAMLARGHIPITDDLVAVDGVLQDTPAPFIWPGFSSMKLWPDTVEALSLGEDEDDRIIHPSVTKVQKRMPAPISPRQVPMGALFVLCRGQDITKPEAVRRPAHEALQMVLRYTFMARYGETRLGRDHLSQHLKRCGAIVASAPVYDLMVPEDFTQLSAVAEIIEQKLDPNL